MIKKILELLGVFSEHNARIEYLENTLMEQMEESRKIVKKLENKIIQLKKR